MYTDEADTPDTHDFYKKLPDKDIEKDDEVSVTIVMLISIINYVFSQW